MTFIGYKQTDRQTDKQTDKPNLYIEEDNTDGKQHTFSSKRIIQIESKTNGWFDATTTHMITVETSKTFMPGDKFLKNHAPPQEVFLRILFADLER